jgi:tetratricopeptide (TPR) repeat protein
MADRAGAYNRVDGTAVGSVVQAGTVHQVVLPQQPIPEQPLVPRHLPPAIRSFVGRADKVAVLDAFLNAGHGDTSGSVVIVAVDGTAGVGKTCLVVWWAHRAQHCFPDGTLFADLGGHGPGASVDPSVVLALFIQALGVPGGRVPDGLGAQIGMYRSLLAGRRVLVVLDNVVDADQVRPLLPGSAGCLVLVTSRAALTGLVVAEGAHRIVLDLFTASEARELVRGAFGTDRAAAEPAAVAELVQLCARLPLALRVATGQVVGCRHVSVAELVEDICQDDRLGALSRTGDERTAVRPVFDWSYNRLSTEHARLFRRLGLHPGFEFGVQAIAALTGTDTTRAHRHLEALVDVHLVEPVERRRYRIHELLHAYAAGRVANEEVADEQHEALTAMLNWYAHTATVADRLVFPTHPSLKVALKPAAEPAPFTDRVGAWAWLTEEYLTLLTALRQTADHGPHRITIALAAAMRFLALKPRTLWHTRLEAESHGLAAARSAGDRTAEAIFLRRRADTHQMLGHWAESDADLERGIALALEAGNPVLHGEALCGLGRNRKLQQRHAEALACYEQALPLVRGTRTGYVEAVVEANLSQLSARLGRHRDALRHAERELVLHRDAGDTVGEAYALHDLATARQGLGDHDTAAALGERAVAIFRTAVATDGYLALALETTAESLVRLGDLPRATAHLEEAATILEESGDPRADAVRQQAHDLESLPGPRSPA